MTIDEFNKTIFLAGMKAKYMNEYYSIISVNFAECLFALCHHNFGENDPDVWLWVRCENVELIK